MKNPKILIIDDDPDITEVMRVVLQTKNYQVISAVNGKEGKEKLRDEKPDLIILDVMLDTPQEGFELGRELKKDPKYRDTPILMVTAVREKTGIDFGTDAGDSAWLPVEDFLDKPIRPGVLLAKVELLLKKA